MLLLIRHGEDEAAIPRNRLNPALTSRGRNEAIKYGPRLIKRYGMPDCIYVSPMKRSLQTVKALLKKTSYSGPIIVVKGLSRYFTENERDILQNKPPTSLIPFDKNYKKFEQRSVYTFEHIQHTDKVIWCITHALVLKSVLTATNKTKYAVAYFEPLATFSFD